MIEAAGGAFVFERRYEEERIIVVINNSNEEYRFKVKKEWKDKLYTLTTKEQIVSFINMVKPMHGQAYLLK